MTTQHTPGPWATEANVNPGGCVGIIVTQDFAKRIADIYGSLNDGMAVRDDDELQANARLIAAAPEQNEALRELWKAVGESGWQNACPTISGRRKRAALLNKARAAIAKAEGGAA